MASLEIDPGYIKCLRLMHSKSKDSEEQLRQMLEDLIRQRNGNTKSIASLQKSSSSSNSSSKKEKHSSGSNGRKEETKRESEKHSIEDSAGSSSSSRESSKKSKTELPKTSHLKSSSSTPTSPLSPAKSFMSDVVEVKEEVKEEDDHDDLALEILEEDLTCVVCHGMDVGVRNQLVECLECHSLYHQECHNPPVPDDMNDPRSAWYCASCTKALKKVPEKSSRSSPKPTTATPTKNEKEVIPVPVVKIVKPESTSQNPFKRSEKMLPRQSKSSSQQYSRSQPQNKQHQLQKLRKMLSPRSPSVGNDKN